MEIVARGSGYYVNPISPGAAAKFESAGRSALPVPVPRHQLDLEKAVRAIKVQADNKVESDVVFAELDRQEENFNSLLTTLEGNEEFASALMRRLLLSNPWLYGVEGS